MTYTTKDIELKARELMKTEPDEHGERALYSLCRCAALELERRLRAGFTGSAIGELFVRAAGFFALSLYLELYHDETELVESFSAGELKLKLRDGGREKSAAVLRARAEAMLSPYLEHGGFEFTGV